MIELRRTIDRLRHEVQAEREKLKTVTEQLAESQAAAAQLNEAAPVFAALGDATRLRLVARLCACGPLSIVRLSEGIGVTRQAVTKHLETLDDAGLVRHSRRGRERIWELETKRLEKAQLSWSQYRDAQAAFLCLNVAGGPFEKMEYYAQLRKETDKRTKELQVTYDWVRKLAMQEQ